MSTKGVEFRLSFVPIFVAALIGMTAISSSFKPEPIPEPVDLVEEAKAERFYRAMLTPEAAAEVLTHEEMLATYSWKTGIHNHMPDSLAIGDMEVGAHSIRTMWHDWGMEHDAFLSSWMMQVAAVLPVHREAVGDGAGAMNQCYDSVLVGGDGIPGNGDEYDLQITKLSHAPSGDGSVRAFLVDSLDSRDLKVGVWMTGGRVPDGPTGIATTGSMSRCGFLTGKPAAGGGAESKSIGRWVIGGLTNDHTESLYFGNMRIIHSQGGVLVQDADGFYVENVSAYGGGNIAGHAVGFGGAGDTSAVLGRDALVLNVSDVLNLRCYGNRLQRWGPGYPRSEPPTNDITMSRNFNCGPDHRPPMIGGDRQTLVQTVIHNAASRPIEVANQVAAFISGVTFKRGPASFSGGTPEHAVLLLNGNTNEVAGGETTADFDHEVYMTNIKASHAGVTVNPGDNPDVYWADGGPQQIVYCDEVGTGCPIANGTGSEFEWRDSTARALHSLWPVDTVWNQGLEDLVMASVGYRWALDSLGNRRSVRNTYDDDRIAEFYAGTGQTTLPDMDTVSVPLPAAGVACRDGDGDGMCGAWEEANGLSDSDATDAAEDPDGDGLPNWFEWHGTPSSGSTDPQVADQGWIGHGSGQVATPTVFVGPGSGALAQARGLPMVVWKLSTQLRNGGTLADLVSDSTSSAVFDVVLLDTTVNDQSGTLQPGGSSTVKHVLISGALDQGSGPVVTAGSFGARWNAMVLRADSNIVVHDFKLRVMSTDNLSSTQDVNFACSFEASDIVLSEMSLAEADDKEINTNDCSNFTIQNTLVRSWHAQHGTTWNFFDSDNGMAYNFAVAHGKKRNIRVGRSAGFFQGISCVNCVFYNWAGDTWQVQVGQANEPPLVDIVGSYYKPGPSTDGDKLSRVLSGEWHNGESFNSGMPRVWFEDVISSNASASAFTSTVAADVPDDVEWTIDRSGVADKDSIISTVPSAQLIQLQAPRDTLPASAMMDFLDSIGSVFKVGCFGDKQYQGGDWLDSAAVADIRDSVAVVNLNFVHPPDSVDAAAVCPDSDGNGLPNDYEARFPGGIEPDSVTASQFTVMEHLLFGLSLPNYAYPGDTATWVDSTLTAISRDCMDGKSLVACTPFGGGPPPSTQATYVLNNGFDSTIVGFVGLDTVLGFLMPDTGVLPMTVPVAVCWQAGATSDDSALVAVRRGDQGSMEILDSATVDILIAASGPFEGCSRATLRRRIGR